MPLRPRPDAMNNSEFPVVPEVIAVPIAEEAPRRRRIPGLVRTRAAHLFFAYRRLVIGHTHVLRPELRGHADRVAGRERDIDVALVGAFRMQVDVDWAACGLERLEQRFPEVVSP